MKTGFFRISFALTCTFLLYGCAMFDKHLLNPAASHASVNPLFRTLDCKDYRAPAGAQFFNGGSFQQNMRGGIFTKDLCEYQALSINDHIYVANNSRSADPKKVEPKEDNSKVSDSKKVDIKEDDSKKGDLKQDDSHEDNAVTINSDVDRDVQFGRICKPSGNPQLSLPEAQNCLNYLISRSNEICNIHKSHIYGDRTVMNTILGTLALGAGVAGTMTGAGAAHFLAGSAGFLTGGQALMDKEIYRNFVTHAILLKIDTNRSEFLKSPKLAYLNESTGTDNTSNSREIGYAKVRNDAVEYHNLCSFYDGLKSLLNEAGGSNKTETANAVLVSQFQTKKQFVENEIKKLEDQLKVANADDKKAIQAKLDARKVELNHINEVLSAVGGTTGKTAETDKTPETAKTPDNIPSSICTPKPSLQRNGLILDVQEALKKAKSKPGPGASDGIAGKKTCDAIKSFQIGKGLPGTGELDSETLKHLGLGKD